MKKMVENFSIVRILTLLSPIGDFQYFLLFLSQNEPKMFLNKFYVLTVMANCTFKNITPYCLI